MAEIPILPKKSDPDDLVKAYVDLMEQAIAGNASMLDLAVSMQQSHAAQAKEQGLHPDGTYIALCQMNQAIHGQTIAQMMVGFAILASLGHDVPLPQSEAPTEGEVSQ